MNPYLVYGGLQAGSALLNALSGDPYDDINKQGLRMLRRQYGKDVIDVPGAIQQNRRAMIPQVSQYGAGVNKRFGLDTGVGQGELLRMLFEGQNQFNLGASMQNDMAKSQRDTQIAQLLALYGAK